MDRTGKDRGSPRRAPRNKVGRGGRRLQPTEPVPGQPWLVWDQTKLDYGVKVIDGTSVAGEFTFRNEGEADLRITNVKTTCECTTTNHDEVVPPGGRGHVAFELDPTEMPADADDTQTIRVSTNCPGHPLTILKASGRLVPPVEVKPEPRARFSLLHSNHEAATTLDVVSNGGTPIDVIRVESNHPGFKAETEAVEGGRRHRLKIATVPPFRPGLTQGTITLTINLDLQPKVTVPVIAVVKPRLSIYPTAIRIRAGAERSREYDARLHNRGTKPVDIVKAVVSDRRIRTKLLRRTPEAPASVRILVPPRYRPPKSGLAFLTLQTDDTEFKEFRIPIGTTQALQALVVPSAEGHPSQQLPTRPRTQASPSHVMTPADGFVGPPSPPSLRD